MLYGLIRATLLIFMGLGFRGSGYTVQVSPIAGWGCNGGLVLTSLDPRQVCADGREVRVVKQKMFTVEAVAEHYP